MKNLLIIFVAIIVILRQKEHNRLSQRNEWNNEYDFIIIGSGSAGSVVASRLSEESSYSVLLLEAGGADDIITDIPAFYSQLKIGKYDWGFESVKQEYGYAYYDRIIKLPRGKGIGGSTLINNMNYVRGLSEDYDNWAFSYNATGWEWDKVLPYFLKAQNNSDLNILKNGQHNGNGPLTITTPETDLLIDVFVNSTNQLGYETSYDANDQNFINRVSVFQKFINNNGRRESVTEAYLRPIYIKRKNLHILAFSFVTKIIFNQQKDKAIGVKFIRNNQCYKVYARKEVIVSAGVFNTPKLLMLSGIGPSEELRKHKIEVIKDLPVGQNYIEIPRIESVYFTGDDSIKHSQNYTLENYSDFYLKRKGPLTFASIVDLRIKINDHQYTETRPFLNPYSTCEYSKAYFNIKEDFWNAYFGPYRGKTMFSFYIGLLNPHSRGFITLKSDNPFDPPLIDPRFLSDKRDLNLLINALEMTFNFPKTEAFKQINLCPIKAIVPGCEPHYRKWDLAPPKEYLECIIKTFIRQWDESCCSCKMGLKDNPNSVVDPQLKIHGIKSLRVIDGSVIPAGFSGYGSTMTIMIAEKLSDEIKQIYS